MSEAAAKRKTALDYAEEAAAKYETQTKARTEEKGKEEVQTTPITEKFANIKENPFHQVVFQSGVSPDEMRSLLAKTMAYEEELKKEDNAEKLAAFQEFMEYLNAYRKEMSKEIIRLSDTEAFGELQENYRDMNQAMLDFKQAIEPLLEILDAINKVNMQDGKKGFELFLDIKEEEAAQAEAVKLRTQREAAIRGYETDIGNLNAEISVLSEQRGWLGFGGVTEEAQIEIARKRERIRQIEDEASTLRTEMENEPAAYQTKFPELARERAKLKELLDLTTEDHKKRQERLKDTAQNYINTQEERSGAILVHQRKVGSQMGNVDGVNSKMQKIFAIVNEGVKDAEEMNKALTERFEEAAEGESQIDRIDREDKLNAIFEHVDVTTSAKIETLNTLGELQEESLRIRSMRENNRQQIDSTRRLHSSGVAGIASQLSTVLTAISAAALYEARTTVQNTLENMNEITTQISQREAIKSAMQLGDLNNEFAKAVENLASFRKIADKATTITRAEIERSKELQDDMESTARELERSIKQLKGVTADVMQSDDPAAARPAGEQNNKKPGSGGGSSEPGGQFAEFNI